jgi:hypothetical protein
VVEQRDPGDVDADGDRPHRGAQVALRERGANDPGHGGHPEPHRPAPARRCAGGWPRRDQLLDEWTQFLGAPQLDQRPTALALHRADGDAEDFGGLRLGEVLEETQHENCPLAVRQLPQRPPQHVAVGVRTRRVRRLGGVRPPGRRLLVRHLPGPPPTSPGHVGGHDDPAHVRLRVPLHPGPGEPGLHEGRLQQVLRGGPVPGDQVRDAQQARRTLGDETVVLGPIAHGTPPHRHRPPDYALTGADGCLDGRWKSYSGGSASSTDAAPAIRCAATTASARSGA